MKLLKLLKSELMIFQPFCIFLFLFLGNSLATFTSFDVFMQVLIFIFLLDGCVSFALFHCDKVAQKLVVLSKLSIIALLIYWWAKSNITLRSIPSETTLVVILSCILEITAQCFVLNKQHTKYNHALRYVVLQICVCIAVVTVTQCLVELADILRTNTFEDSTDATKQNCTTTQVHTKAIIFNTNTNYELCPSEIWKLIRINFIFAAQAYILYTLTTAIYLDFVTTPQHPFVIGFAAVLESVCALAAVVGQFDIIYKCYDISITTWTLLNMALIAYLVRKNKHLKSSESKTLKDVFYVLNGSDNICAKNKIATSSYMAYTTIPNKLKL